MDVDLDKHNSQELRWSSLHRRRRHDGFCGFQNDEEVISGHMIYGPVAFVRNKVSHVDRSRNGVATTISATHLELVQHHELLCTQVLKIKSKKPQDFSC